MTKRKQTGSIKLLPLGGLGEIGMNCLVLETERDILVIDCGVMFGDLDPFGIDFIVPNLKYLEERREKVRAVVFTHGHEDHIGAFPFLLRAGIEVPAYASPFTSMMLESRLREAGLLDRTEIRRFKLGGDFRIGEFRIRTVPVNHSIVESVALCIDTPAGRIIHTGDFRIDSDPYFGNEMRFNEFKKWGEEGVLLLLSDSTNVERDTANDSERVIYDAFDSVLEESGGSTFFSMFSSNIGRMGQVFELARKHHKRVTVTGRSMQQNVELASKAGYFKDLNKILVPPEDIETVPRKRRVILSTGSQGEYRSALSKLAKAEHPFLEIQPEDAIVISSRFIPGNEKAVSRLINNLFRRGAHVHYEPCDHVHVSGHATRPELKKMIQAVKPKYFIPIHGEYRHLVLHAELADECKVEKSLVITNGEQVEVSEQAMHVIDEWGDLGTLIDGPARIEVANTVLSQRRKLAERGAVSVLVVMKDGRLVAEPRILSSGVFGGETVEKRISDATAVIKQVLRQATNKGVEGHAELEEMVRIELRRHFQNVFGKKSIVFPWVVEL